MSSPVSFKRPARRRSTHPVLSDLPGRERWWLDPSTASATSSSRQKRLHFRSGDPFDRFVFVRYLSIAFSLIVPLIVLKATVFRPTGSPIQATRPIKKPPQAPPRQAVTNGFMRGRVTP